MAVTTIRKVRFETPCLPQPALDHIWILAPNGKTVKVELAIRDGCNDIRPEVATPDYPLLSSYNSKGYRIVPGVKYQDFGFVKIGNYYVDPKNARDVKTANERADWDAEPWLPIAQLADKVCGQCFGDMVRWCIR